MDLMDASDFWDKMDTTEVTREEIVLVASYIAAYWRRHGSNILADTFVKQANIEEVKELEYGTDLVYLDVYMKNPLVMDYWTFYCHEKLMLERRKVETLKLEMEGLTLDTSQERNPLPLKFDEDNGVLPFPKINALCKLSDYTVLYTGRNFIACSVAAKLVENGDNPMLDPEKVNKVMRAVAFMESNDAFGDFKLIVPSWASF